MIQEQHNNTMMHDDSLNFQVMSPNFVHTGGFSQNYLLN